MVGKTIGLSRDFIIHPGETLNDLLIDRGISQVELAHRTGVSEPHVSKIINGQKAISVQYAKKLEYALGIEARFWINLQANYDADLLEFEEQNGVSEEELSILNTLKDFIIYLKKMELITPQSDRGFCVLELRKLFQISDLSDIPRLAVSGAFRVSTNNNIDVYVLFAWIKLCHMFTEKLAISEELNVENLKTSIPMIKKVMFEPAKNIQKRLEEIFSYCGIAFCIIRNFKGAPVHGYIKKRKDGKLLMAVTIRGAYADIFWFSLFHEIAHILNNDIGSSDSFIDYSSGSREIELLADRVAADLLIPETSYQRFLEVGDFSLATINTFAESQGIPNYMIIGRLQKDGHIPYSKFSSQKSRYYWAE